MQFPLKVRRNFVVVLNPVVLMLQRVCFVCFCVATILNSQIPGQRPEIARRYVIHRISLEIVPDSGQSDLPFTPAQLRSIVTLQATDFSMPSRILREVTYNGLEVSDFPRPITMIFARAYAASVEHDLRYFDRSNAEYDVLRLQDYITQFGYHDARVRYKFRICNKARDNELIYTISLGKRYKLDTLVVLGIDRLPPDVQQDVHSVITRAGTMEYFREDQLCSILERVLDTLRNSGYVKANYAPEHDTIGLPTATLMPIVISDTVRKRDSVTVFIEPGRRYRIGTIIVADSTRGNPVIGGQLKQRQLLLQTGEWYSPVLVDASIANLMGLGTFDRIRADTTIVGDTVINVRLLLYYRRVWEASIGWFFNSTFPDNFNNTGVDFSYVHRNLFNAAQALSAYIRPTLRNTSYFVQVVPDSGLGRSFAIIDKDLETGALFTQPDWFRMPGGLRVDASGQLNASYRFVVDPFKLLSVSFRGGISVPLHGFHERVSLELSLDANRPERFDEALQNAYRRNPMVDTMLIKETLEQYRLLNDYAGGQLRLTSAVLAVRYWRDLRNDLFFPSRGNTLTMFFETTIARLLSSYSQAQLTYTTYHPAGSGVAAFKGRVGYIWWHDPATTIVPFDRHYFAGGAVSIRGYPSRQLVDLQSGGANPSSVGTLANYIGSGTVVELSAELRYNLGHYSSFGDFLAEQISRLGFVLFADAGNVFNRLTRESYGTALLSDVFNLSRWALVMGSGIRYALPAGPARLDFGLRVYDPMNAQRPWVTQRIFLRSIEWQIGIGHAF